jgi:hypothetical protein
MNVKQRVVLLMGALLFVALGIFVPWHNKESIAEASRLNGVSEAPAPVATAEYDVALGYAMIFSPPGGRGEFGQVDISRLAIEWLSLTVLTGSLIIAIGKRRSDTK